MSTGKQAGIRVCLAVGAPFGEITYSDMIDAIKGADHVVLI